MDKIKYNVAAVIVTYEPNIPVLNILVATIKNQVKTVYIIDNGSSNSLVGLYCDGVEVVLLNENYGIAHAQNIGIKRAIKAGYGDFILFDQDSEPAINMVESLFSARYLAQSTGLKVAAVGPVHIDKDSLASCIFIDTSSGHVKKIKPDLKMSNREKFFQCDFVIASGCLLSKNAIFSIGYMDDELFIDCVDIEWGYRASGLGLVSIVALDAKMSHKIGDKPLKFFGINLTTHSPLRHYYFYRNFYYLLHKKYIPSCWKKYTLIKSFVQFLIFSTCLAPRYTNFRFILKGMYHGLIGKIGRYE